MIKNTTINLRVNSEKKEQASEILSSLGMTLSQAFDLMIHQVCAVRGLPFEVKQRLPMELNDGYGSYMCEFGYTHDYSKHDWDAIEAEMNDPNTKTYKTTEEMWAAIEAEDDEDNEEAEV
jgi:addiction module RelB/DinJ family antitoxin